MWVDNLPLDLKAKVSALIRAQPSSEFILKELYDYMALSPEAKKRKLASPATNGQESQNNTGAVNTPNTQSATPNAEPHTDQGQNAPINPNEVIFELSSLSFTSPMRRKMNLVFHLTIAPDSTPHPLFSVVNVNTGIPEISIGNLRSSIKLCCLIPILGNSTVPTKKNTAMLCFWLNDDLVADPSKNDPIICTFNLDLVKKQLAKDGKIPPDAEARVAHMASSPDGIKPINELIIDFLERQFSLCGISLFNFMPSAKVFKNQLNMNFDSVIAVSAQGNSVNDFLAVEAYKGSKEGALLLVSPSPDKAFLVFGFKKPITILDFSSIKDVSYKDISKFTFTAVITYDDHLSGKEATLELSMIDQKSHQAIDEFIRRMNIADNSFDNKFRETAPKEDNTGATGTEALLAEGNDDDDEEEDVSYTGEPQGESDSDLAEEFDSNAESGESDLEAESGDETEGEDEGEENEIKEEIKQEVIEEVKQEAGEAPGIMAEESKEQYVKVEEEEGAVLEQIS